MTNSSVYEKTGDSHTISLHSFYAMTIGFVCYGLVISGLAAYYAIQWEFAPVGWNIVLIGFMLPLFGIYISRKSSHWFWSFVGYNMVVIPFGFLLGPLVKEYNPTIIRNVCMLTAGITLVMGFAGTSFPQVFSDMGRALFLSLLFLLAIRIIALFVPQLNELSIIDYAAAGLFSLYIGYDMYRTSIVERNTDNAVQVALSLYLDVLNLFTTLLRIARQ